MYHNKSTQTTAQELSSDLTKGLHLSQIPSLQQKFGENRLREKKGKSNLARFFGQFKDAMILILIAAAAVSFVVACIEKNPNEFFEPLLILLIVVLNAILGVIQESKAQKALDALKTLSAPHAKVIRDGTETVIDATGLVPGDLIRLEAGDFIPADARLIKSASLKCEESALTGESVPSEKDADAIIAENAPLGDRNNMVFSGCSVSYGTAFAIVTATGMHTEMGKIANLLNSEENTQTPLQKKLSLLGTYLGILALAACVIIFLIGFLNGIPTLEIFMTAVSLAVSAIPEGLPAIVTIILSIGVQRMVHKNAIIRSLPAVETLGSASVICSDKTGTLTQNRMTLVKAWCAGSEMAEDIPDCRLSAYGKLPSAQKKKPAPAFEENPAKQYNVTFPSDEIRQLLAYGTLCSNGSVLLDGEKEQHIGDPTETAIVLAAHNMGMPKDDLNKQYPRLAEIPFDSDRKLMSAIHRIDGKIIVIVKGAFDVLAARCPGFDDTSAKRANDEMSQSALRVLAIAYKEIPQMPETLSSDDLEQNLTFLGLVGMIDPPRPEAKKAVAICKKAGIRPVMITGDHVITASAIAKELGILQPNDKAITGTELDLMDDAELDGQVEQISVYARVSPENKIRIVKAWQKKNHVVSMTGDGVNDAPALKAADIGCAMGITGTDVAKGAADITLTDDNFATIVDAVREGRGIYANIKKVVGFLLGTNIGEVVCVFLSMLLWHKTPLLSMQLLWINLVTDSLPAIALGMEAVELDIMEQRPKPREESLFANGYGIRIFLLGLLFDILALAAFFVGERMTGKLAGGRTFAFFVLAFTQVLQAFNMRSERSLFHIGIFTNHSLNKAALISVLLVCLVLFTPLSVPFGLITLPFPLYILGICLIFVPIILMELAKFIGWIKI